MSMLSGSAFAAFLMAGILNLSFAVMADIYDRALALATRMLAPRSDGGKGLAMVLTTTSVGEYDPATGTAAITTTNYDGSAFRDTYRKDEIDGTRVLASDVKFLVSPVLLNGNTTPDINPQYKMTFDSQVYTIMSVSPWNYAGLNVGFEVQGRL